MDGGPVFQLSYRASRDDYVRGFLARFDRCGVRTRSRIEGGIFLALGLLTMGLNLQSLGTVDEVGPLPWLLSGFMLLYGLLRWTMWDRRWTIGRSFRVNAALLDVELHESLDDREVVTRGPGQENRLAWSQFTAVIECDDLLVLCLGDGKKGGQWTTPKRGLADPDQWPDLVAFARERVPSEYFRSRR